MPQGEPGEPRRFIPPNRLVIGEEREPLALKLQEYRTRVIRYNKAIEPSNYWNTVYKIEITQVLIATGEVEKETIRSKIERDYGVLAFPDSFDSAWGVIANYVVEGGKGTNKGEAGLPRVEEHFEE
jgi:hypothetical protein